MILAIVEVELSKYWLIQEISELAPFSRIFFRNTSAGVNFFSLYYTILCYYLASQDLFPMRVQQNLFVKQTDHTLHSLWR